MTVTAFVTAALVVLGGCDGTRAEGAGASSPLQATAQEMPRLVDLGAGKCIPCKAMAPVTRASWTRRRSSPSGGPSA